MTPCLSSFTSQGEITVTYSDTELMLLKNKLLENGFVVFPIKLSQKIQTFCHEKKWQCLDDTFLNETKKEMPLHTLLNFFHEINSIEFIISLRESVNDWEEDGIWHDDGSRKIAFSLSLTHLEEIKDGGVLEVRKKGSEISSKIPTPEFGNIIIFLTGIHGFEHKINMVNEGKRLIIAGWGS